MLEAKNISWTINHKKILQNINMEIKKGECLGLVGPNGSGKSSLLKILSFLQTPSSGKLFFEDRELPPKIPLSIRRKIAVVFQEPLLLNMSVFTNVAIGLKIRRLPKKQIRYLTEYWLDTFGIAHLQKEHAYSLSGGEAQRASLARAFALSPEILFLDEPFSALDAPTIEALLGDLKKVFQTTGITTMIVSHNIRDIDRLADRLLVMLNGEIKAAGSKQEIFSQTDSPEAVHFLAQLTQV